MTESDKMSQMNAMNNAASVPSPCRNICRMTADRSHCEGCWRTLDEIRAWRTLDDAGKRAIWAAIACRSSGAHRLQESAL